MYCLSSRTSIPYCSIEKLSIGKLDKTFGIGNIYARTLDKTSGIKNLCGGTLGKTRRIESQLKEMPTKDGRTYLSMTR